ncbi:MAG: NAD-dependent epimerase/dehydratase family protein [Dehalococcoidia bacterium]|nr:NAD-dependent epimerase/dehydratase family protein [Dehalococcoidia bacterium]
MKCVVTGASGHVGANMVRALLHRGHDVRAVVHVDRTALAGLDLQMVEADVSDLASLRRAFDGGDVVYHLAGHISISGKNSRQLADVNVEGVRNVVRACLDSPVLRLVHFSSIHAFARCQSAALVSEDNLLVSDAMPSSYDSSKAEGELLVMDAVRQGLDAVVVVPTAVVGPHDFRPSHFGQVVIALARNRLPALVSGGFDWVDVRDVVDGAIVAAECAPSGRKYVLSGHWVSIPRVAAMVRGLSGARVPPPILPLPVARACCPLAEGACRVLGRPPLFTRYSVDSLAQFRHVSHERATSELGYQPRPFEDTLADTYRWFRANGYLGAPVPEGHESL